MRVSRGIFRLWVFVTALWLGGTVAITYLNWLMQCTDPWNENQSSLLLL